MGICDQNFGKSLELVYKICDEKSCKTLALEALEP